MAISHVNQVAAANVANINGVEVANIGEIQGATADMAPTYNSKGTPAQLEQGWRPIVTYDEDTDRVICVHQSSASGTYAQLAYTVAKLNDDGTFTTYTQAVIDSASCKPLAMEYHKRLDKVVLLYNDDTADKAYVTEGTVTGGSTNTISWTSRELITNNLFTNANGVYTTVHNGGDVVFVKINPNDSQEKFNWIYHIDACDVTPAAGDAIIYSPSSTPSDIYRNDQSPDAQDHGITWGNLHGGTNAVNSGFHAGRNSPSGAVTGQLGAWSFPNTSGDPDMHYLTDGGWVNLDTDDDTENYQIAWDEKIGKGLVVAQSHAGSYDSAPYYWQFTHDNSDQSVTVNTQGDIIGTAGYGINCMYDYDAGVIPIMYVYKHATADGGDSPYSLDLRMRVCTLNSSNNNIALSNEIVLYDGEGGYGQSGNDEMQIPPTTLSPDRIAMCYTSGSRKGIVVAYTREDNGTGYTYLLSISGQGTTDYSNTV